jgi:hypothetical protein
LFVCAPAPGRAPVPAVPPPAVSSTSERGSRKHVCLRVCGGGLRACERGCPCVALTDGRRRPGGLTYVPRVQGWLGWARGECVSQLTRVLWGGDIAGAPGRPRWRA